MTASNDPNRVQNQAQNQSQTHALNQTTHQGNLQAVPGSDAGSSALQSVPTSAESVKAERFRMLEDIAKELSSRGISFPTCFDVALNIRTALKDPDLSLDAIAKLVAMEPLVVTKLLRMANSASLNPSGVSIVSVDVALQRIGIATTRSVVMAVAMGQLMRSKELQVFGPLMRDLWLHSVRAAAAACVLADAYTDIKREDALLAGLVHDLGAFYMIYRVAQYEEWRGYPEIVHELMVHWHESVGETLMVALELPEHIIEASHDHDFRRSTVGKLRNLSDVVYVANLLAGGVIDWSGIEKMHPENCQELQNTPYLGHAQQIEDEFQGLIGVFS